MLTYDERCEVGYHLDGLGSGRRGVRLNLNAHFSECERLSLGRRDFRDGAPASFGKEADLIVPQILQGVQGVKDFRYELQQVECLSNSCSERAKMFCQVWLGGASALLEEVFENERLFYRIDDRYFRRYFKAQICGVLRPSRPGTG